MSFTNLSSIIYDMDMVTILSKTKKSKDLNKQYDSIAKQYTEDEDERLTKKYIFTPTFFKVLGDIKGKKILDVACGDGYLTRKMREKAARITGCDISKGMIALGKKLETQHPLGIKYFVSDAGKLGKIDSFDIVTAGFLLHYSPNKKTLARMCKNIFINLKKGGRFVAINHNSLHPLNPNKKYGNTIKGKLPLREGDKLTTTFYNSKGKKTISFDFYYWDRETYENSLKKAGFKSIKWFDMKVSKSGINRLGKEFWEDYYKHPSAIIIEARK